MLMKICSIITYVYLLPPFPAPLLEQRTSCPESYACLSLEYLGINGKGEMQKIADVCEGGLSWKLFCLPGRMPSNQSIWQYPRGYPVASTH